MKVKTDYSRKELIELCERSFVNYKKWGDRDSPSSQTKLGMALALLRDGCPFEIKVDTTSSCCTDKDTIWIDVWWPDFMCFEDGVQGKLDKDCWASDLFYIPTSKRLNKSNGEDWY